MERLDDTLAVGKRYRIANWASTWTVLWRGNPAQRHGGGRTTRTRVHFMRWDDIIRSQWKRRPAQLARDYWNVYARGLFSGAFARIWRKCNAGGPWNEPPLCDSYIVTKGGLKSVTL